MHPPRDTTFSRKEKMAQLLESVLTDHLRPGAETHPDVIEAQRYLTEYFQSRTASKVGHERRIDQTRPAALRHFR